MTTSSGFGFLLIDYEMSKQGFVYLIGAGPGDPGLLTIKGKECLEKADVLVYDYLVNPSLLQLAKKEAEKIYVGKKNNPKRVSQEEINKILIEKAREGKIIARVKGGDPFIFGRGGEEAEELSRHGIPFEIIPGVSSISAVPAYAGIPITHRNLTSSFAVITGHEYPEKEKSSIPWEALSKIETLVLLMGVRRLEGIIKKLIEHGKPPDTPIAVITWGTLPRQKTFTGTIGEIGLMLREESIKPPAVIVIGKVVNLRNIINWFETKPLFGKRILVTRAKKQAGLLSRLLSEEGADVIEFPTIEITPPESWSELDRAIEDLGNYDWIVFTSVNGVLFFFERLKALKRDIRDLKGIKIATIGEQTAKAVRELGIHVDIVPEDFRAEGIVESFKSINIEGKKILIPRAKEARETLPTELSKMGARVYIAQAYQTRIPQSLEFAEKINTLLLEKKIDVITFTSPSTVRNFLSILGNDKIALLNSKIACIGPVTAEYLRGLGIEPHIICKKRYTIEELVKEIVSYFRDSSGYLKNI